MKVRRTAHDGLTLTLTYPEAVELINDLYFAAELSMYPAPDRSYPYHARDFRKYAQLLRDGLGGTP